MASAHPETKSANEKPGKTTHMDDLEHALGIMRQMRDEIRLHLHLAGMEAKTKFGFLEKEYAELESATHAAGDNIKSISQTLLRSFHELRDSIVKD